MLKKPFGMALLGLFLVSLGCEARIPSDPPVSLDKIPSDVMAVAKRELPGVDFEKAWKGSASGEDTYEIRGRDAAGKTRELKISASGKVLEVE